MSENNHPSANISKGILLYIYIPIRYLPYFIISS